MRLIATAMVLMVLWLLMSGLYKSLIVSFGVLSVVLVLWVMLRMNKVDEDQLELTLGPIAMVKYFAWLMLEIAKSNWIVTKTILSPKMPIAQNQFYIPYSQKTDLAQVVYANSITLTPGTITVETEPGEFLVHALSFREDDYKALAEMDRRVSAVETGGRN